LIKELDDYFCEHEDVEFTGLRNVMSGKNVCDSIYNVTCKKCGKTFNQLQYYREQYDQNKE
jgi:hypothetical protein